MLDFSNFAKDRLHLGITIKQACCSALDLRLICIVVYDSMVVSCMRQTDMEQKRCYEVKMNQSKNNIIRK